jgi:hypothetical protein
MINSSNFSNFQTSVFYFIYRNDYLKKISSHLGSSAANNLCKLQKSKKTKKQKDIYIWTFIQTFTHSHLSGLIPINVQIKKLIVRT